MGGDKVIREDQEVSTSGEPRLESVPLGLDDYQPEDLQEKYWSYEDDDGWLCSERNDWRPGFWIPISLDPNDIRKAYEEDIYGHEWLPDAGIRATTIGRILDESTFDLAVGIVVIDGYPNAARYIEVRPGDR